MFVARKESGWNTVSKAMKYATAIRYNSWALGWGVGAGGSTHGVYEVVFMGCINVCLERKGKGGYGVKQVLRIYLVQATW